MDSSVVDEPLVCVVVAAYNSPPDLRAFVDSLNAQTWDRRYWEVRFVDDGSTDDTLDRLEALSADHANYHVDSIPNSGWPGRPRNVAVAQTSAEYVFFADHDDYFFPDALRRMYEFASSNDLDLVHPKEVVAGWNTPGWRSWPRQEPRAVHLDQQLLQCITPHKLYRRRFLEAHEIRFPEGPVRLEDFSYNADVWARTDKIGILADYPCYRWMIYADNSHKKSFDFDRYWKSFESSLQPLVAMADSEKKDQLLVRWYRSRILERMAGGFHRYSDSARARLLARVRELLPYFPAKIDRLLDPADRTRSVLLRADEIEGLLELSRLDDGTRLKATSSRANWTPAGLEITVEANLVDKAGEQVKFQRRSDGRIERVLPEWLRNLVGDATTLPALDEIYPEVVVRGRESNVDWIVPTSGGAAYVDDGNELTLLVTAHATIDPAAAALGSALDAEVQDIFYRLVGPGLSATHRVPAFDMVAGAAVLDGMPGVVYRTRPGFIAIDLDSKVRTVVGTAQPDVDLVRRRFGTTKIPLPQLVTRGKADVAIQLEVDGELSPAVIRVGRKGGRVETRTIWTDGQRVRVRMGGRFSAVLF